MISVSLSGIAETTKYTNDTKTRPELVWVFRRPVRLRTRTGRASARWPTGIIFPCVPCIPRATSRHMSAIEDLRKTIARLRGPGGCPWDQEQTHAMLVRCLIDEASELIDTIDRGDFPHMREELGDVLIQVVFHAQLAEEAGHFDLEDVAREVNEKLIRPHPHVFGNNK